MTAESILKEVKDIYYDKMISDRRNLHKIPGIGFDIKETVEYVRSALAEMGIEAKDCGKAGLSATIGSGEKVFMLRADMDALSIREDSGLDFAAENGLMHACGHDIHTAMLLTAARVLKAHESELEGTVKLMFQPSEENFSGALDMIEGGVLENPVPQAAAMIHVAAAVPMKTGTLAISAPGVSLPAADYFEINIQGKGCHGSMPNDGIDPITIASHIVIALQAINAREVAPGQSVVLTMGQLHAGKASNVIPDTATLGGTIRTYDEEVRSFVKERLTAIAEGAASVFRGEAKVKFTSGCPSLYNDPELVKFAGKVLPELPETTAFVLSESKGGGSEDFAYISRKIPSLMINLAAGSPEEGYSYPQHHPKVCFNEDCMVPGAAALVQLATSWLAENK